MAKKKTEPIIAYTDYLILRAMLKKAGIEYEIDKSDEGVSLSVHKGYQGFVTTFNFDDNGNLKDMGAWE